MRLSSKFVAVGLAAILLRVALTAYGIMLGVGILNANGIITGTLSFLESLGLAATLVLATFKASVGSSS